MSQVVQITRTEYESLLERLSQVERILARLIESEGEPREGTEEWWEWSDRKALQAVKRGEYKEFDSAKEMVDYLKQFK